MKLLKNLLKKKQKPQTDSEKLIKASEAVFMPLLPPQPMVPDRADGVYIYDMEGNKYLDYAAGIAVNALGHNHPAINDALVNQSHKVIHIPGTYVTEPKVKCAEFIVNNSCFDQVFFCNSGTEAIEGAFKLAKKWAYETKGEHANEIIVFKNAFHGRTMAAASMTNKRDKQPFYGPYIDGIHFADFNDIESVKALISEKTAAIFIEPVQGEGGILPADKAFLTELREICTREKIALVFDEIQAGIGRLGTLFAYQTFGIEPDIAAMAKGLGSGFPIGAITAKKEFGDHFNTGAHGSTYGGNPLATAVALNVLTTIAAPDFLHQVKTVGQELKDQLEKLKRETSRISEVRGIGLMIGVDTDIDNAMLRKNLQDNGLLTTGAGQNTLRITPPLILEQSHVSEGTTIIEHVIKEA